MGFDGLIGAKRLANFLQGFVVRPQRQAVLFENGQGELGETDVALGHRPGHGHAHIIAFVADGAKAVEHSGDVIGLDEIEHEEHDGETHGVFVLAVEPLAGEVPNTITVLGQQAARIGELEGVAD